MNFANKLKTFILNLKFIAIVYFIIASAISLIQFNAGDKIFDGEAFTHYNNYLIFSHSYHHLTNNQNPYQPWPEEHWDLYKYSPTFALLMYPFSLLPDLTGLLIWNLFNAFILFIAIITLKNIDDNAKGIILLLILPELAISLQNSQSNGLVAGLIINSFNLMEDKKFIAATLLITLCAFIKIFGLVAFLLCIFYKERWKAAIAGILWIIAFALLPVAIISFAQLKTDYLSWWQMLANDQRTSSGLSVLGLLKTWFNYDASKNFVSAFGITLLCIPLVRFSLYADYKFRTLMLAAILIWAVIFNHKAESPTFIIAMAGAVIWYLNSSRSKSDLVIFLLVFVFTSLSSTDFFPRYIRVNYIMPYALKAVPLIFLWIKIEYDLLTMKSKSHAISIELANH